MIILLLTLLFKGKGSLEVLDVTVDRVTHDKANELHAKNAHSRRVTAPSVLPIIDVDLGH